MVLVDGLYKHVLVNETKKKESQREMAESMTVLNMSESTKQLTAAMSQSSNFDLFYIRRGRFDLEAVQIEIDGR